MLNLVINIFNKVNHHELSGHFFLVSRYIFKCRLTWLVSASLQLHFSVFALAYQLAVCVFKQLMLLGFETLAFWGFWGCLHSSTPPSLFLSSTDSFSVDGCVEWGLMAGLRGFASHGSGILSRGWLNGHSGSPWISQAPTFHLSEAAVKFVLFSDQAF